MASDDVGLSPVPFYDNPENKRHPNNTKTDQLPIFEVITGLSRPYHNIDIRQEERRGMCSDTLNPSGEVRGCCVGCILGMSDVSPFAFIAAVTRYTGFLELKKCFFKRACFGCGEIFWCSDWHEIVILVPLHLMPV